MTALHHVLVGSGIAALSAAEAIRSADPRARITMVSLEDAPFYSRPGLAYLLTNELPEAALEIRSAAELAALRLERVTGMASRIDTGERRLVLQDGRRIGYDRLLIATGASSMPPDFPGAALDGVVQVDGLSEARDFVARSRRASTAIVVGGGSTALELVDGLHARGVTTHYLLRGDRYWSKVFDPVESAIVEARLLADGVQLHRVTGVREAIGTNGVLVGVTTTAGRHLACDLLAVAVGVRPRLELARASGVAIDRGILTNEYLETSVTGVFAAGDAAQVYDPVTHGALLDTLWASALQQGRIAGLNMAGVRVAHRKHPPINVTRVAGITATIIGAVGTADDPDLLTLTRGQSERWATDPDAWSVAAARRGDRLRVVVSGRAIVGAVVMGDQRVSQPLAHLIGEEVDISALRPALEAAPEDAMDLLLAFCDAHVGDHAAEHR
ncbi:MAG: FAD-dependent oxidoreductase [Gemmatimonadales bacterium]|nr:FAD-dependent oxidoreductase [Gemmatimonadales bacterium]MBP6570730.1 FAD-dependent oxidoreductase [Gemmatimonadales bacterium]MBP7620708.1 FAD-dependent oxidoreductase [Gemmatimonadales bacterium]